MDREEFHEHLTENVEQDLEVLKKKNQDYSRGEDPFQNFRQVEEKGLVSVEEGIAVRMSDKFQRMVNLIESGERAVEDESLSDTLSDLRNYSNILQVYIEHEKPGQDPSVS
jgi:hypothetical protein|nr:MAG: hypothetical protein J07AB56_12020 [Candidatus Nanosalinarum sp. J07AB56]